MPYGGVPGALSHLLTGLPSGNVEIKTTQAIRSAKIHHFKEKFSSCGADLKMFWKTVKSMEK